MSNTGEQRRLLVVVAHEGRRALMHTVLAEAGFSVESVAEIDDAVARIEAGQPDAVVTDVMPGNQGSFRLLHDLRGNDNQLVCQVPVVISTGRNRDVDRVRAWELQCDGFVARPHHMTELIHVLREVIGLSPPQRVRRREEMFAKVRREVAEKRAVRDRRG